MSYQVTARKWRPMVFDDVIGQSHVSNTLRNALSQNRLAHAFIFSGTRGCGKTTTARILARAVNCLSPKNFEPDNSCEICKEIIDGRSLDIIEIDGASNRGVEEIRNLRESVRYAPTRGKKKVYIIDEVHMLTKEAFNALLKTLEEPPPHVLFIFATTEIFKVPATILSRCQRYDFRRISVEEIQSRLRFIADAEKITIDDDALLIIAKKGDGSMRDAQSIFDQVISFCGMTVDSKEIIHALNIVDQELYFRFSDTLREKDAAKGLQLVDEVIKSGYDIKEFLSGLSEHYRNMLIVKSTQSTKLVEESEAHRLRYQETVEPYDVGDLLRILKVITETEQAVRYAVQPRFKLEVMVILLSKMDSAVQIDQLLEQLEQLSGAAPAVKKKLHSDELKQPAPPAERAPSFHKETFEPKTSYVVAPPKNEPASKPKASMPPSMPIDADPSTPVTLNSVLQHWPEIVESMRKKKISVGTVLGESQPTEIINGVLRIGCSDEFHRSTLVRNKEILTQMINETLSSKIRIEPFIGEVGFTDVDGSNGGRKNDVGTPSQTPADMENHPIIQKLYKDFGVEKI